MSHYKFIAIQSSAVVVVAKEALEKAEEIHTFMKETSVCHEHNCVAKSAFGHSDFHKLPRLIPTPTPCKLQAQTLP